MKKASSFFALRLYAIRPKQGSLFVEFSFIDEFSP